MAAASSSASEPPAVSLPYHEPSVTTILILSAFLILLNTTNKLLDHLLYCGLIAQVLLGTLLGTPLANILTKPLEETLTSLGYLGLILLVFEGGLSTSFASLKSQFLLSSCVAATGIFLPIGLSFTLVGLSGATYLQAFAAGAALCSTSLGTTFTVLRTAGLVQSRLGVVLTSAAMMDDVVGLVMVRVIGDLGSAGSGAFNAETVARPVGVSIGAILAVVLLCRFVAKPFTIWIRNLKWAWVGKVRNWLRGTSGAWAAQTGVLAAFIAVAGYAGTSVLLAAYLAGAAVSWWYDEFGKSTERTTVGQGRQSMEAVQSSHCSDGTSGLPEERNRTSDELQESQRASISSSRTSVTNIGTECTSAYEKYYLEAVEVILKPFFFASIGFSIPITRMFTGNVVWRGFVYTILMLLGKILTGVWLIKLPLLQPLVSVFTGLRRTQKEGTEDNKKTKPGASTASENVSNSVAGDNQESSVSAVTQPPTANQSRPRDPPRNPQEQASKPTSLYPGAIIGNAMVARGEIGFLIASTADANSIFGPIPGVSEIYLVVVWGIVLCTIIGPVTTGLLVKRVRRLQTNERNENERPDPLGAWGVS